MQSRQLVMLLFCCFSLASFIHGVQSGTSKSAMFRRVHKAARSNSKVVIQYTGISLMVCAANAVSNNRDHSYSAFNYNPAKQLCEGLNDNWTSASLIPTPDFKYYEMHEDPCLSKPCLYDGICETIEIVNGDRLNVDFKCTCQYPMGGKICADLICENCYRRNDLVLFLNNTMSSTSWIQSYNWCAERGFTLVLDKDQAKHDFIVESVKKEHPSLSEPVCYWIGLNRTSVFTPFKYIDGTPVTKKFQPWSPGRPATEICVEIANGQDFQWRWDDEACNSNPSTTSYRYYPLCEKYYPFLK